MGDVVIIHEEGLPRSRWRLGRICTLIKGKDGHVRGARVTVCTKQGKISEIERPLQKLYPLELSDSDEKTTKSIVDNDSSNEAEADTEVRVRPEVRDRPGGRDRPPRRSAALNADIFRRLANSKQFIDLLIVDHSLMIKVGSVCQIGKSLVFLGTGIW